MRNCNAVVFGLLGRVLVGCGKPAQSGVTCFIAPVGRRDGMSIRRNLRVSRRTVVLPTLQMKTSCKFRRGGFTLLELLYVIAIIAILLALSLQVFPRAFGRAKKLSADNAEGQKNIQKMIDAADDGR